MHTGGGWGGSEGLSPHPPARRSHQRDVLLAGRSWSPDRVCFSCAEALHVDPRGLSSPRRNSRGRWLQRRSAANIAGVPMILLVRPPSIWRLVTCAVLAVVLVSGNVASATLPKRGDVKATLARQPQLLSGVASELQPPTAGLPQLYFVGFAGFGGQAVFKREVLAVRQLFDERFGTRVKLTRFRGDPSLCVLGVHDAQEAPTLCTRVPAADGRAGAGRPFACGVGR